MSSLSRLKVPCFVTGDLNIDFMKCLKHKGTSIYLESLLVNNFLPVIVLPTRITVTSATLIDHIYFYEGSN